MATQRDDDDNGYRQLIGDAVRRRRLGLNLSQGQLADRLGQHRQYVGRLESGGDVSLTLDAIAKIAAQLEMPATELLRSFLDRDARRNGFMLTALVVTTDRRLHQRRRQIARLNDAAIHLSLAHVRSLADQAEGLPRRATGVN